jgi:hypothetical protein
MHFIESLEGQTLNNSLVLFGKTITIIQFLIKQEINF